MRKLTIDEFISRANNVHAQFYDYSKVVYKGDSEEVRIICPKHGAFLQKAGVHLRGCGCPQCAIERVRIGRDDFVQNAMIVHEGKYDYSKVIYKRNHSKVCIICPIHGEFWQTPANHLKGQNCPVCAREKRKTRVVNIGVNDEDRLLHMHAYSHWRGMMERCYSDKGHKKRPSYQQCNVCDEWRLFSNFIPWFYAHHKEGWHLDKDILIKGNKTYSPQNCCFVPSEINGLFAKCDAIRGDMPIGVQFIDGVYVASMRKNKKKIYLGRYKDALSAFIRYKQAKEEWIKQVADKYKDCIAPNVYEALYKYKVDISD